MAELVGLTPSAWCEHGITAQGKPKEVEDGAGYAGRICDQIFIAHEVRPDLVRERATRDGFHVFQPNTAKGCACEQQGFRALYGVCRAWSGSNKEIVYVRRADGSGGVGSHVAPSVVAAGVDINAATNSNV